MRFKKSLFMIVGVFALILALAACGGAEDTTPENNTGQNNNDNNTEEQPAQENEEDEEDLEDVVISFMHLWPEGSSKKHYDIVDEIIADFEDANPNVTIDLEVLSNEQYKDKLKVLSASDELPDVGFTWAAGFLEPYVSGNMFAPLDDIIDDELSDLFVAGTAEAYAIDGVTYGLPLELNIASLYYNSAMFDEYDLEAPETYEDLENVINVFNENGIQPVALGNKDRWTGSLWYMYLADRIGGADVLNKAIDRTGTFEDPALIEAAEKVQDLVDMDAFVKGFNGLSDEEAKSMFMNEQAPMYLIATWDLPNYTTNEEVPQEFRDSVEFLKFPTVDGEGDLSSFVGGPGVGLFVAEDSDVKDAAKDFAAHFVKEWGDLSVTRAGVIPATKVDADSLDLHDMYIEVLDELNAASNLTLFADVQMSPDVADVHLDMIQAIFGKEVTPEEFAEEHEDALSSE